jgi:hypothetical protein
VFAEHQWILYNLVTKSRLTSQHRRLQAHFSSKLLNETDHQTLGKQVAAGDHAISA